MTINELRQHPEYALCMKTLQSYPKGFQFTVLYYKMTQGQKNAMTIILRDAVQKGLIRSIAVGVNLDLEETKEAFERV